MRRHAILYAALKESFSSVNAWLTFSNFLSSIFCSLSLLDLSSADRTSLSSFLFSIKIALFLCRHIEQEDQREIQSHSRRSSIQQKEMR